MAKEYSVEVYKELEARFRATRLYRPMRIARYDGGTELIYDVRGVEQAGTARVHLVVEKFVGGGFAGQVYQVKVLEIEAEDGSIGTLEVGRLYAMKILTPPSGFSRLFRNMLYWVGFQGPFQLQVNPEAARTGALWQKFVRRGAKIRFGDEGAVVDIHATFVDDRLGACGELSEWVDGRTWRLEVDERLDLLKQWSRGKAVDEQYVGSAEYLMRGSVVQFDRGNVDKLEDFMEANSDEFVDMRQMLEELKAAEQVYRNSIADITHNHVRLLYSGRLWSTMLTSAVTGWKVRNLVDQRCQQKLRSSRALTLLFFAIGLVPFLGGFVRRIWGREDWRKHYKEMLTSWGYLKRAIWARIAEKVIIWHRAGRVGPEQALKLSEHIWQFLCHLPLSLLPVAGLHRFLTDAKYAKERLVYLFVRPVRLYFNAELREKWLHEMVTEGQKKHMLTPEDANTILSQINEPFIQKYLKSLAVHVCTLPVTQIVSVLVATIYVLMHPELTWDEAGLRAGGILLAFQVTPISPGSLVRGFYVLYLVIRERNFKDYNIAVFLGFFKYIGYLAFPIQMTYRYPALARFMAAHWATSAVHIVPVFGERGALLEHWVFCLFYNWPLTIRCRMRKRAEIRSAMKPRYWHVGLCAVAAAVLFGFADFAYLSKGGKLPGLKDIWWLVVLVPLVCGALVTLGCGGAVLWKRVVAAAVWGIVAGALCTAATPIIGLGDVVIWAGELAKSCLWRVFVFSVFSTVGAIVTELKLPAPDLK